MNDHTRQAFLRDLDVEIEAAIDTAHIDQQSLHPASLDRSDWMDSPTDFTGTLCWLLDDATRERYREHEQQIFDEGKTAERKLSDFGGRS